eukprot:5837686-Prymnesium_polylepis.2
MRQLGLYEARGALGPAARCACWRGAPPTTRGVVVHVLELSRARARPRLALGGVVGLRTRV